MVSVTGSQGQGPGQANEKTPGLLLELPGGRHFSIRAQGAGPTFAAGSSPPGEGKAAPMAREESQP